MEEIFGLTSIGVIVMTGMVAGATELVKRLIKKDWTASITILSAGLIGGLVGLTFGLDFYAGVVFGLGASGYITIGQNIGKKME